MRTTRKNTTLQTYSGLRTLPYPRWAASQPRGGKRLAEGGTCEARVREELRQHWLDAIDGILARPRQGAQARGEGALSRNGNQ